MFFADIRVNTIKHAMIAQMQNPSTGFEDVIKAHFYLKKERILQVSKDVGTHFVFYTSYLNRPFHHTVDRKW